MAASPITIDSIKPPNARLSTNSIPIGRMLSRVDVTGPDRNIQYSKGASKAATIPAKALTFETTTKAK